MVRQVNQRGDFRLAAIEIAMASGHREAVAHQLRHRDVVRLAVGAGAVTALVGETVAVRVRVANRTAAKRGDRTEAVIVTAATKIRPLQRIREGELSRKLYHQLGFIPGVIIDVEILLSPERRHVVESTKINDKPTALQINSQSEEETIEGGVQGRPGLAANNRTVGSANSAAKIVKTPQRTVRNVTRENQNSVVGSERTTRELLPFSPKHTTVSINIPKSYV